MADQTDVAIPRSSIDDNNRADWAIHGVCCGDMGTIRRPRWTPEVGGRRRIMEWLSNGFLERKIRGSPYFDGSVVALEDIRGTWKESILR